MAHAQAELEDEQRVVNHVDEEHEDVNEVDDWMLFPVEDDTERHQDVGQDWHGHDAAK